MAIVIFALPITIYEIFANQENCQSFDSENGGQGQRVDNRICALQTEMFESIWLIFSVLSYQATHVYVKDSTHSHLHTQREIGVD